MYRSVQKLAALSAVAVGALSFAGAAQAQTTTTDQFGVQIEIQAFCAITNPTDMDFGIRNLLNVDYDATSTFDVQCTNTTPFDIGLDQGDNFTAGSRQMVFGGEDVNYDLYTDAGRTDAWGDTIGADTLVDTGDGLANSYTVYGRVPGGQTTPQPGIYTDTVTIEVTY